MPVAIPLAVAGAIAGAGVAAKVVGGIAGANAEQNIANAQRAQAQQNRDLAMGAAAPTSQELQQIGDRLRMQTRYQAVQEAGLERDKQLLDKLDPALQQAGQQAFQMMKGQQASILAPMKMQQDMQRKQLQAQLAAQYGPGFATSAAGQQAMQSFNMQADLSLQGAQMSAFQNVSQFMGFGMQQRTSLMNEQRMGFHTADSLSMNSLQAMGGLQHRQVDAINGTAGAMNQTAGFQHVGAAAAANVISGVGDSLTSIGTSAMGAMGGMGGGGSSGGGVPSGGSGGASSFSGMNYSQPASKFFGLAG